MSFYDAIPYCGSPPVPGYVAWNLDPLLCALLAVGAAAYFVTCRYSRCPPERYEQIFFAFGWMILALALVSPIWLNQPAD